MCKILLLLQVVSLLLVLVQVDGLSMVANGRGENGAPSRHVKRSLCNTFGGCGNKRSLRQATSNEGSREKDGSSVQQQQQQQPQVESGNNSRRDSEAGLIDEVLGDLIEYMQNNEKYRQGKFVLVVPKHTLYGYEKGSPMVGPMANNHATLMEAGSSNLQELQILKPHDQ